eukprot:TRINITY_DN26145_c0_g1_i2.p1 TRINITY_DN26145_c0_g1~~TRINITY_DN26145_c0_g1_i2.p1  ORF type:complete len:372 (+),score=111.78 TRINITY_DN26145_c0_g1_i2:59-1117(+)
MPAAWLRLRSAVLHGPTRCPPGAPTPWNQGDRTADMAWQLMRCVRGGADVDGQVAAFMDREERRTPLQPLQLVALITRLREAADGGAVCSDVRLCGMMSHGIAKWAHGRGCRHVAVYNAAMGGCTDAAQWRASLSVYAMLTELAEPDEITSFAACGAVEAGARWRAALGLAAAVLDADSSEAARSSALATAAAACGSSARWRSGLGVLRFAARTGTRAPTRAVVRAMLGCVTGSRWRSSLQLYRAHGEARLAAFEAPLSRALWKGSVWASMLRLVGGLHRDGCAPDVLTIEQTVAACDSTRAWRQSLRLVGGQEAASAAPAQACGGCGGVAADGVAAACWTHVSTRCSGRWL